MAFSSESKVIRPKTTQPETGVRIEPAPHGANRIHLWKTPLTSPQKIFAESAPLEAAYLDMNKMIQTSFQGINENSPVAPASNGFVDSVFKAYAEHHHLVIRPEDVWFSILIQINTYINAHGEELRSMFVNHEGQELLSIAIYPDEENGRDIRKSDMGKFAYAMGQLIEQKIKDPTLRKWFMPSFTTTKKCDQAAASIIMMGAMQKYFGYELGFGCGLPSVTLLGEKTDWEDILSRLDRLKSFGEEPTAFCQLLKPVMKKFIESFEDPDSDEIREFWERIVCWTDCGSGHSYLSGWITAFCYWKDNGACLVDPEDIAHDTHKIPGAKVEVYVLEDARYHRVDTNNVPPGYCTVSVTLYDINMDPIKCQMIAGSVGMQLSSSGAFLSARTEPEVLDWRTYGRQTVPIPPDGPGLDTIQPGSGWWMFEVKSAEDILEEKRILYKRFWRPGQLPWEGNEEECANRVAWPSDDY